jgi:hypothetical protein
MRGLASDEASLIVKGISGLIDIVVLTIKYMPISEIIAAEAPSEVWTSIT